MRRRPLLSTARRPLAALGVACLLAAASVALLAPGRADAGASLDRLRSQLGAQRSDQAQLSSSIRSLDGLIATLDRQIDLVHGRAAAVEQELTADRTRLTGVRLQRTAATARLARLRRRLAAARARLADQLVAGYEQAKPSLVAIVLDADGFSDLLDQLSFLGRAENEQKRSIATTTAARAATARAARRLAQLQRTVALQAHAAALRQRALAGMNHLLGSRQSALAKARAAQAAALAAGRARAQALRRQISTAQAAQAAAAAAAAASAAHHAASQQPAAPSGPALGSNAGWAIPYAIVLCESGGQDLPPNGAGASGYYQIIPSTWTGYGGTGPAAYLAPKREQDAVASRIWDGGRGAGAWDCASIVGIH